GVDLINTEDSTVYVRIMPNDGTINGSYAISGAFIVDTKAPASPTPFAFGTIYSNSISLTWATSSDSNFSHYEIWYSEVSADAQNRSGSALEWDHNDDSELSNVSAEETTITGLSPNSKYYFKIWVIDSYGNETTVSNINRYTLSAAPNNLAVRRNGLNPTGAIDISWQANNNSSGTEYFAEDMTFNKNSGWIAATSWTFSGLDSGVDYFFRVKSRNGNQEESAYISSMSIQTQSAGGAIPIIFLSSVVKIEPIKTSIPVVKISEIEENLQGEKIIIQGEAQAQSKIIIYIQEKEYTASADNKGKWAYEVPEPLQSGEYKIQIKAQSLTGAESDALTVNLKIKPVLEIEPLTKPEITVKPMPGETEITIKPKISSNLKEKMELAQEIKKLKIALPNLGQIEIKLQKDIIKIVNQMPALNKILSNLKPQVIPLVIDEIKKGAGLKMPKIGQYETKRQTPEIPSDLPFFVSPENQFDLISKLEISGNQQKQTLRLTKGQKIKSIVKPSAPANAVTAQFIIKKLSQNSALEEKKNKFSLIPLAMAKSQDTTESQFNIKELIKPVLAKEYVLDQKIVYYDNNNDGIWEAEIETPLIQGKFILRIYIDYKDPNLENKSLDTLTLIDPEGYVYTKIQDGELRIKNAVISLYVLDPKTKKYQLWDSKYTNQPNPQITDQTGQYSYLVPEGTYYLKIEAKNYKVFKTAPFKVQEENGVHKNIELEKETKGFIFKIKNFIKNFIKKYL
ncbi:hypothetical protein COT20_00175, partial [bacterium (Candidatus Gribaldobacteria) CG08_land_8_20_14_0_20_39_15]